MRDFEEKELRRKKRFYHRCFSGMDRGGPFRFITLTSGPDSPEDIHRSFTKLKMRIRRRGVPFEYICVKEYTRAGRVHLHLIFRGTYLRQQWLSSQWEQCHNAKIVDIRRVKGKEPKKSSLPHYLAKYLAKESCGRFWWSWAWVYRGWKSTWRLLCSRWWWAYPKIPWPVVQDIWKRHLADEKIILGPTTVLPAATVLEETYKSLLLLRKVKALA